MRSLPGRWALVGLGVVLLGLSVLAWSPFPAGIWHDDGVYVLLGRALAEGEGLRYTGVSGAPPAGKFPPLYPLTLAGLWSLSPDVEAVTAMASALNLFFLAIAALLFARLLHRHVGVSPVMAAVLAALAWLPLPLWRTGLVAFSEPLFLLLLVGAATLACRLEERSEDRVALGLLILVALASIHVRTVGVAVVVAAGFALFSRGRRRAAAVTVAGVVAGSLPWAIWSARAGRAVPEELRDVLGPYGGWLLGQIRANPTGYLLELQGQARDLVDRVVTLLVPAPPAWEPWFGDVRWLALAILVPAFFLGLDRLWSRSRTPVLLVFTYLVIVWLWPFRDNRLLVPVAPFLILLVAEGFRWSGEGARLEGGTGADASAPPVRSVPSWVRRGWRGTGIVWASFFAAVSVWSLAAGWAGAGYEIRTDALARSVRAIGEATPPDAVVGAPELWAGIHLHTGRTVAPSARFLPVRSPDEGPSWGTPAEQHRLWEVAGIDHLVLEQGGGIHGAAVDRVSAACGRNALRRIASWRGGQLARLAWTPECRRRLLESGGADGELEPASEH